jgi:hypothetical protein
MIRTGEVSSAALRIVAIVAVALLLAMPRGAAAQEAAAPPAQQEDLLKLSASPHLILFQIAAEKTADFEAGWAMIKDAFSTKVQDAQEKAFGETLGKLFKLDQPPVDTPGGKAVVYVLQLDSPGALSYNPIKIIYETLWKNGAEGAPLKREEADVIYKKFEGKVFLSINPWKLNKVG